MGASDTFCMNCTGQWDLESFWHAVFSVPHEHLNVTVSEPVLFAAFFCGSFSSWHLVVDEFQDAFCRVIVIGS